MSARAHDNETVIRALKRGSWMGSGEAGGGAGKLEGNREAGGRMERGFRDVGTRGKAWESDA